MSLELTSPAFTHEGAIPALYTCDGEDCSPAPALYTCDGEDRSPALRWSGMPAGTKSLVLMMEEGTRPMLRRRGQSGCTGYSTTCRPTPPAFPKRLSRKACRREPMKV